MYQDKQIFTGLNLYLPDCVKVCIFAINPNAGVIWSRTETLSPAVVRHPGLQVIEQRLKTFNNTHNFLRHGRL